MIPNPVKQADGRSSAYIRQYGDQCWELDAVEPDELITLCEAAVEMLITDEDAWEAIKEKDEAERQELLEQLQRIAT